MSIIFGISKAEGQSVEKRELSNLAQSTQRYAPDGTFIYAQGAMGMGFQPYHTHQRSNLEALPLADERSNVLTFDGRLDNYTDLCDLLGIPAAETPDSHIVLKAFERWGEDCFARFVGDWALAFWAHSARTLYLARDHAGSRSLYFQQSNGCILWSTYLETFFTAGRVFPLDEEFAALYCACKPTRELTPYRGIRSVPAAHYLRFRDGAAISVAHWQWIIRKPIVYGSDAQYEEHFFELFQQSVRLRTGPGAPILAQLSGGMDSTSIVCMSDHIRRTHDPSEELLDTVSFYDNSEPNWDEFPFFTAVEKSRGKAGLHLDASYTERSIRPQPSIGSVQLWPGADNSESGLDARLHHALKGRDFRAVLSGLGGDEVLGGVPTPLPELADLMVKGNLFSLSTRSLEWCLANRTSFLHLLSETLQFTYRLYFTDSSTPPTIPPWLSQHLRNSRDHGSIKRTVWGRLPCLLPTAIANGNAWWSIQETLPTRLLSDVERFEYRYPFLDRNLVEFLFSIPRRQIVAPRRRRSLMRRALKNIVPNEILERRRKAYLIRGPINLVRRERDWLSAQFRNLCCVEMGLVDPLTLPAVLDSIATEGNPKWLPYLMRLVSFELWLRSGPLDISPPIPIGWPTRSGSGGPSGGLVSRKFDPTRRTS